MLARRKSKETASLMVQCQLFEKGPEKKVNLTLAADPANVK